MHYQIEIASKTGPWNGVCGQLIRSNDRENNSEYKKSTSNLNRLIYCNNVIFLVAGQDLNLRPSGYEPDETLQSQLIGNF